MLYVFVVSFFVTRFVRPSSMFWRENVSFVTDFLRHTIRDWRDHDTKAFVY